MEILLFLHVRPIYLYSYYILSSETSRMTPYPSGYGVRFELTLVCLQYLMQFLRVGSNPAGVV